MSIDRLFVVPALALIWSTLMFVCVCVCVCLCTCVPVCARTWVVCVREFYHHPHIGSVVDKVLILSRAYGNPHSCVRAYTVSSLPTASELEGVLGFHKVNNVKVSLGNGRHTVCVSGVILTTATLITAYSSDSLFSGV